MGTGGRAEVTKRLTGRLRLLSTELSTEQDN